MTTTPGAPPAEVVDLRDRGGERPAASLSPSRASDFLTCPLLYRLRSIDRLPEPPGVAAARGTLVHAVLERLFDVPAAQRTPDVAAGFIPQQWEELTREQPHLAPLLFGPEDAWQRWLDDEALAAPDPAAVTAFLGEARSFVDRYFALEDPTRLEPAEREVSVTCELPSGLVLRGIIDRVDRAPNGAVRVVDYKTGRAPGAGWEAKALFQMRFYGLVLWRRSGQLPARLQLLYLGSGERISIDPTEAELVATERKVQALWETIAAATRDGQWPARPSKLCSWCSFQSLCPEYGGTPPPLPPAPVTSSVKA